MSRLLYQAELHRHSINDRDGPADTARAAKSATLSCPPDPRRDLSPNTESNRRPSPYHGDALPTELLGRAGNKLPALGPAAKSGFPNGCRHVGPLRSTACQSL